MTTRSPRFPEFVDALAPMNPVHLAKVTGRQLVACNANVDASTRRTIYPALVTCAACAKTFNAEQRRMTDPNPTEPEGV